MRFSQKEYAMKKFIMLILAGALVLPVFASNGDTFNIGGVVPLTLDLTVTPQNNWDNLDLSSDDLATTVSIAAITIHTNNSQGWELYIFSANSDAGNPGLRNDDNDPISYTLVYGGTGAVAAAAVPANVGDGSANLYGEAAVTDVAERYDETSDLTIGYTRSTSYPAGYYSDQLTLVLRAK